MKKGKYQPRDSMQSPRFSQPATFMRLPHVVDLTDVDIALVGMYVSLDIDCVDPAFAPGTGTPEVGGLDSYEAITFVRALKGLDVVGFDLVEVTPLYDSPGQVTIEKTLEVLNREFEGNARLPWA